MMCKICGFETEEFPDCGQEDCMQPCCPACNSCARLASDMRPSENPVAFECRVARRGEFEAEQILARTVFAPYARVWP